MKKTQSNNTHYQIDFKDKNLSSTPSKYPQSTVINISKIIQKKNEEESDDPNRTITESDSESDNEYQQIKFNSKKYRHNKKQIKFNRNELKEIEHGRWTIEEHRLFLEGLMLFGNEWKLVQKRIRTRSATQARSHAQKFFIKLRKEFDKLKGPNEIRTKIRNIFKDSLEDKFQSENSEEFIDMMIKLIYTPDNANHNTKSIEEYENSKDNQLLLNKEINGKADDNLLLQMNSNLDSLSFSSKRKIFSISKDESKKKFNFKKNEQNQYQNISQNFQGSSHYINFVTINMVDNSYNNYINQNSQLIPEIAKESNNGINMVKYVKNGNNNNNTNHQFRDLQNNNPFDIEFEPLIGKNNIINYQDDKLINENNDELVSLLNFFN